MNTGTAAFLLAALIPPLIAAGEKPADPPMPPVEVRAKGVEWGPRTWTWEGVALVDDPANKERLFLGGRVGGAEFGTIGSWALAEDGKTWREMTFSSAVLDPLRARCQGARRAARDAVAAARSVYYAGMEREDEAAAVKAKPLRLCADAHKLAEEASKALEAVAAQGWEAAAVAQAKWVVREAPADLRNAQFGTPGRPALNDGVVDGLLLRMIERGGWSLDEAADCLANSPEARQDAAAAYDPENKCVVLFGGSHGDYVMSDTWVYDCTKKQWRQVWPKVSPAPRAMAAAAPRLAPGSFRWDETRKRLILSGGVTILDKMAYQQGFKPLPDDEWEFDAKAAEWTAVKGGPGVPPGTRIYRTIVPAYGPCWYDAAPRGDPKAVAAWLDSLKPNVWTEVPMQDRPCPERDWGTARYDPDRDQVYRWTGGHCADPSNVMSTYHPGINRWSIPYVPEIYGKGMSFNGRPDCLNHTYLHMAYDPVSKRLVCTSMGGTGVYDPDRREWDFSLDQPFNHHIYETCTVSTPQGVVVWTPGFFGTLDVKAKEWKKLPVNGKLPKSVTDGSALTYDSKRDAIWMLTFLGYQKPSGQIWRYEMKTGAMEALSPAGQETIGKAKGFDKEIRECVYLPRLDLVLVNNFVAGHQVAYDPAKNRWVLLGISKEADKGSGLGGVSLGLVCDTKRDLLWGLSSYKRIFVLKIDPKTLTVSDELPK